VDRHSQDPWSLVFRFVGWLPARMIIVGCKFKQDCLHLQVDIRTVIVISSVNLMMDRSHYGTFETCSSHRRLCCWGRGARQLDVDMVGFCHEANVWQDEHEITCHFCRDMSCDLCRWPGKRPSSNYITQLKKTLKET
jgi:hypothetical protein